MGRDGLEVLERLANAHVETALVPGAGHDVRRTRPAGFYDPLAAGLRRGGVAGGGVVGMDPGASVMVVPQI